MHELGAIHAELLPELDPDSRAVSRPSVRGPTADERS